MTRKTVLFKWTNVENTAFQLLKRKMTTAPVLKRPICGKISQFVISTDAPKFGLGDVLLQVDSQNKLQPCAYFAKSLTDSQRSYSTYDQELLAIVATMAEWRVNIEECKSLTVITDHTTLQHLPKTNDAEKLTKVPRRYILYKIYSLVKCYISLSCN